MWDALFSVRSNHQADHGSMAPQDDKSISFRDSGALFLCRPDLDEGELIREQGKEMHGLVLQAKHLVRKPDDPPRTDLGRAARELGVPHVHDPNTDVLAWHVGGKDTRFGRAGEMACAMVADLPLDPSVLLADHSALEEFVRATISTQVSVSHPSPPYFRFAALDDPWLELSLRAAEKAQRLSGGQQMAVFVNATLECLESGALALAAARYRTALPDGAIVFLSVGGLHSEDSEPDSLASYIGAIDAFRAQGFEVIADRIARFGAASVAAGARGYCAGTRVYRHAAAAPEATDIHRRGARMQYEAPGRGDRIPRRDVARRLKRGSIPPCSVPGCPIGTDMPVSVKDLRCHSIHLQQLEVAEAAELGQSAWIERLAESPRNFVRGWAEALRLSRQAREAA
jgi:hypothetical protein